MHRFAAGEKVAISQIEIVFIHIKLEPSYKSNNILMTVRGTTLKYLLAFSAGPRPYCSWSNNTSKKLTSVMQYDLIFYPKFCRFTRLPLHNSNGISLLTPQLKTGALACLLLYVIICLNNIYTNVEWFFKCAVLTFLRWPFGVNSSSGVRPSFGDELTKRGSRASAASVHSGLRCSLVEQ